MKIEWTTRPCIPQEDIDRNIKLARSGGYPYIALNIPRPALAVVGGSPSVIQYVDELSSWDGDVWACGSAFHWCAENGIRASFFNVDPQALMADLAWGARHGILSTATDKAVFDLIPHVEIFELVSRPDYYNHGVTAATATPFIALEMGYKQTSFFGCESSFERKTHVYKDEIEDMLIHVKCGEEVYVTKPHYLLQAVLMAKIIRVAPHVFIDKSGGLLSALIKHDDYDIVSANKATLDTLDLVVNGEVMDHAMITQVLPLQEMAHF